MNAKEPAESQREILIRRFTDRANVTFVRELVGWVRSSRKWWLLPVLAVIIALGSFLLMASSVAAPFIYPFF